MVPINEKNTGQHEIFVDAADYYEEELITFYLKIFFGKSCSDGKK